MVKRRLNRCGVALVKHCNLSCTACNHLSPIYKPENLDLQEFERVTSSLADHLSFNWLVLQGGEPLLHPQIDQVIRIAKTTGLAPKVSILTNGILLHKMSSVFWETVDLVELSAYPKVPLGPLSESQHAKIKRSDLHTFTESFSTIRNEDADLVRKIKDRCHLFQRCYAISGSYFYKCIIASFIPEKVSHELLSPQTVDGIHVDGRSDFSANLTAYIEDETPLRSCEFCAGTIGKRFPHTQTSKSDWLNRHKRPIVDMLDQTLLSTEPHDADLRRDLGISS